ncbi:MAG: Rrf2 family transcriptional regulator [Actinomycetota bacterium]|nr:Rrf2 family transcriptional regulator [Actinomycetota bacterium]
MLSNTHFSIAVHILTVLAYRDGEAVASADLARSVDTNPSFLRGLIGSLRDAGLVETSMGKGGGARLARDPSRISLRDVYRATESGPALRAHECSRDSWCPVAAGMGRVLGDLNQGVESAVDQELASRTIGDLVSEYYSART